MMASSVSPAKNINKIMLIKVLFKIYYYKDIKYHLY